VVVELSRIDRPARIGAGVRRALGRRGRVELYFAFDDPNSAVAVIDLAERLAEYEVLLLLRPVVNRGIPDDPATEDKRRFAVTDAGRLFERAGLTLRRTEPLRPEDTAFLAEWAATSLPGSALTRFCVAAMRELWLVDGSPVTQETYSDLWREFFGGEPPAAAEGAEAVRANERRMARRGPYDTPAAWVHGRWWFAHDRLPRIGERLDELGWRRTP
jgi:2-hydroxychromene-2-carboxylate isomerase